MWSINSCDQPLAIRLGERKKRSILSGGDVEDLAWALVVAGDAGADRVVSATGEKKLGNFRIHTLEVCQCVEDGGLAADAVCVDIRPAIDVGTPIQEETGGFKEAVFGGDVEKSCAT